MIFLASYSETVSQQWFRNSRCQLCSTFEDAPFSQAESQIRLHPRDSMVMRGTVKHYDSKTEEAVRRLDEFRALPVRRTNHEGTLTNHEHPMFDRGRIRLLKVSQLQ